MPGPARSASNLIAFVWFLTSAQQLDRNRGRLECSDFVCGQGGDSAGIAALHILRIGSLFGAVPRATEV